LRNNKEQLEVDIERKELLITAFEREKVTLQGSLQDVNVKLDEWTELQQQFGALGL
jgi:hypothetical protein